LTGLHAAPALRVVVSIPPLKGLIEPLLPPASEVTMLVRPGRSEHGSELTPTDAAAIARADIVVIVGLGLEPRVEAVLEKHAVASRRVVRFADVVGLKQSDDGAHHCDDPDHHHEHAHDDAWVDQHLWLDPALVEKLVPALGEAVRGALDAKGALTDANGAALRVRTEAIAERVREVDKEWNASLAPAKGRAVVTHHDAFSRPAERYGLRVVAVIRPGQASESSPQDISHVIEAVRTERVETIFFEPQFGAHAAERIARRAGVKVAQLDPLGEGDWFELMQANLRSLCEGLVVHGSQTPSPEPP
jgi:ABC-type Zn uptake system ZnuABC Zn-binding protein ZnuA